MNEIESSRQKLMKINRQALMVLFICYLPHIATEPLWLSLLLFGVIAYRLLADYYSYPPLRWWMRILIVIGFILVLFPSMSDSGFFIRLLLTFVILKCLEMNAERDVKVIILCNFLLIFAELIMMQELWIVIYMMMAIFANLGLMIKLNAPDVPLSKISSKSGQQLLIVAPLSLLLFFIFPRIDPFWQIASSSKATASLQETMNPGTISGLFNDDSVVMQVTFPGKPKWRGYWRGIFLNYYTGTTWFPAPPNYATFTKLIDLQTSVTADYEILLEPTRNKWLFYEGYPVSGRPNLIFSSDNGLVRANKEMINERFNYALSVQSPPYQALTPAEYAAALQLPADSNPRLTAWAKEQFAKNNNDVDAFIKFLHDYIREQPFWYTLLPHSLINDKQQMDMFWFETQQGFCEHYASAVTFILRAVGIPARVILGYHGGKWNPLTRTITIYQYNAHAWLEYWQEGKGWQQLDPTAFISPNRVEMSIRDRTSERTSQEVYFSISAAPFLQQVSLLLDSARFYSQRWFLYYNQNTQQNLLESLGLGKWNTGQLLQLSVSTMPIFFLLLGLYYKWRQRKSQDPVLYEYHLLQNEFRKLNITLQPSTTLKQQCDMLMSRLPSLTPLLHAFIERYEALRLKSAPEGRGDSNKATINLFKKLRYALSKEKIDSDSTKRVS